MWFPGLLLLFAFTSVIADVSDDIEECAKEFDVEDVESWVDTKGSEDVEVICPMVVNFFSCMEEVLKSETGMTLEEMAELTEGTDIGGSVELVLNVRNLAVDLCTEGSQLNTDLMADIECVDDLENPFEACEEKAVAAYNAFSGFANKVEEEAEDEDFDPDFPCMKAAYQSACIASAIHDKCGRRAFDTYNTIVKRSTIFKNAICSEQDLANAKTTFLDSLEMEENKKELFRLAFDLRKRRK
uniref:Uncharacterized protein n=1 Tax=Dolomedes sulfureus TaxID=492288 RepID=A0A0N7I0H4_9ARAC|nr:hypothetical protein [Dolomedes sulfureus]